MGYRLYFEWPFSTAKPVIIFIRNDTFHVFAYRDGEVIMYINPDIRFYSRNYAARLFFVPDFHPSYDELKYILYFDLFDIRTQMTEIQPIHVTMRHNSNEAMQRTKLVVTPFKYIPPKLSLFARQSYVKLEPYSERDVVDLHLFLGGLSGFVYIKQWAKTAHAICSTLNALLRRLGLTYDPLDEHYPKFIAALLETFISNL